MRQGLRILIITLVSVIGGVVMAIGLVFAAVVDTATSFCVKSCKPTHHLIEWGVAGGIVAMVWVVLAVRWLSRPTHATPAAPLGPPAQPATLDE